MVPAVSLNYGMASILTPSDFPFSRDGILAEGNINQEMMLVGELNMSTILDARTTGTVLPLLDSRRSREDRLKHRDDSRYEPRSSAASPLRNTQTEHFRVDH